MRRSLVNLSGLAESDTKVVTGCLRMTKVTIFVVLDLKGLIKNMNNMGLCLYMFKYDYATGPSIKVTPTPGILQKRLSLFLSC